MFSLTGRTFGGLYYDLDSDTQTESLNFTPLGVSISNRLIAKNELEYSTTKVPVEFRVYEKENVNIAGVGGTTYDLVGWQGEKWIAIKGVTNKIAKLALEMNKEDKKTLAIGETWSLGSGYDITINAIDAMSTPRQVWFTLRKNGSVVDEQICQAPQSSSTADKEKALCYKTKTILDESDALLFMVYVDSIFKGAVSDMVQFKYAWLIDESSATEIKSADRFGVFEVRSATSDYIQMTNENIVTLSRNTETALMGEFKLKVADNDNLRFYPKIDYVNGEMVSDTIPPVTMISGVTENGSFNNSVTVTLDVTDNPGGSGVEETMFIVNGGSTSIYTMPFVINTAGQENVIYWSNDKMGNVESQNMVNFTIVNISVSDTIPPVTMISGVIESGSFNNSVTVTFNSTDNPEGSGVNETMFIVNGGPTSPYTIPFVVDTIGQNNVTYWSTDKMGNVEPQNMVNFTIVNKSVSNIVAGIISGYKINDTNGNGKWDAGDKGISYWTIRLIGITGKGKDSKVIRKETFTDATGFYKFDNLSSGRYFVIEKLKKGFVTTSYPVKRIKLIQYENSMNNNFTNKLVNSRDQNNDKRNIDDYETINRDIDKYKEDMNWDRE
jgi:S-layer protein (TIGR01567 family)